MFLQKNQHKLYTSNAKKKMKTTLVFVFEVLHCQKIKYLNEHFCIFIMFFGEKNRIQIYKFHLFTLVNTGFLLSFLQYGAQINKFSKG